MTTSPVKRLNEQFAQKIIKRIAMSGRIAMLNHPLGDSLTRNHGVKRRAALQIVITPTHGLDVAPSRVLCVAHDNLPFKAALTSAIVSWVAWISVPESTSSSAQCWHKISSTVGDVSDIHTLNPHRSQMRGRLGTGASGMSAIRAQTKTTLSSLSFWLSF
jgi:hypothetical protein